MPDPGDNPIWTALNTTPKYVASTTLTEPKWSDTTVLSDDLATAIADLKAKPGGELQVHGSGALVRWLLDNQLVDELTLFLCPVVIGQGMRLFPATGPDMALDLVASRSTPKGVTIQVYRPTGRPQYGGTVAARTGGSTGAEERQVRPSPGLRELPGEAVRARHDAPRFRCPGRPPVENHGTRKDTGSLSKGSQVVASSSGAGPPRTAAPGRSWRSWPRSWGEPAVGDGDHARTTRS
jgi:dihydrofolate reductase